MACTIAGAAAGAAALTPAHATPARSIPVASATPAPPATSTPCMRFIGDAENGCTGQFGYGGHHFGHWRHHRDWDGGWWQGQAQPVPAVPSNPNGGMVGAQTDGTF
jgi:hypothetical protein